MEKDFDVLYKEFKLLEERWILCEAEREALEKKVTELRGEILALDMIVYGYVKKKKRRKEIMKKMLADERLKHQNEVRRFEHIIVKLERQIKYLESRKQILFTV